MKRFVHVHTGEIMAGKCNSVLKSDANRACLVIAAYDSVHKIGGLAHAMFLSGGVIRKNDSTVTRDAESAIDEMIEDMELLGATKNEINVCLVTGENVPHEKDDPQYHQSIKSALEIIKHKQLKLKKETTTDIGNLHVSLDVETGRLIYE